MILSSPCRSSPKRFANHLSFRPCALRCRCPCCWSDKHLLVCVTCRGCSTKRTIGLGAWHFESGLSSDPCELRCQCRPFVLQETKMTLVSTKALHSDAHINSDLLPQYSFVVDDGVEVNRRTTKQQRSQSWECPLGKCIKRHQCTSVRDEIWKKICNLTPCFLKLLLQQGRTSWSLLRCR